MTSNAIERSLPPWWVRLAVIGGLSGMLSWGVLDLLDVLGIDFSLMRRGDLPMVMPLSTIPGVVFGVVFGALLLLIGRVDAGRAALYPLAAGVGYLAAYHAAFFGVIGLSNGQHDASALAWVVGGALGGLTGTLLLGLASKFLLEVPAARTLGLPVIVGTLAGGLLVLVSWDIDSHDMPKGLLAFFALWQSAYAASLAPLLADRR